ncbi:MAG TPA: hypothetical protein DIT22_07575 [Thermodesulfobacterium commune]|uniref:YkgJ family cysteine cluster protein n=1 Tax=Thermodesulfobacterium commune TaxID=1741 RepID=A0A3B8N4G6_9BACT|nr:hypothetical protein [Thermodesulfobacterium commune]HBT04206.1 hypothetical protein [Thermodesulfobacterium commune]HCP10543.1 hypothetical protein [Thermodesulfobacterium commune]
MNVFLDFEVATKLELLKKLYEHLENTYQAWDLFCKPGCNLCCTQRIYATSLEAYHLLEKISPEVLTRVSHLQNYPRPKITHNQTLLCYLQGTEPPLEDYPPHLSTCPFLDEKGLCMVYPYRPLMCRIMASTKSCEQGEASLPPFLFYVGTLALQLAENIDIGGLYGNLFDLLKFLKDYKEGQVEEVPPYLLSNVDVDELPVLPEEKDLRSWVGTLYRTHVTEEKSFREVLQELREKFRDKKSLSFLEEIF